MSANTQSGNPITPYANLNQAVSFYGEGGGPSPGSGVTQIVAGTGISISPVGGTGNVTITSTGTSGVSSIAGTANEVTVSAATGAVTVSLPLQIQVNSVKPSTGETVLINGTCQLPVNATGGTYSGRLVTDAGGSFQLVGTNKAFVSCTSASGGVAFTIVPPASIASGAILIGAYSNPNDSGGAWKSFQPNGAGGSFSITTPLGGTTLYNIAWI